MFLSGDRTRTSMYTQKPTRTKCEKQYNKTGLNGFFMYSFSFSFPILNLLVCLAEQLLLKTNSEQNDRRGKLA